MAENLAELKMREIVMRIESDEAITATVFNLSGRKKEGVIETIFYTPQLDFAIKDKEGKQYQYTVTSIEDQTDYILGQGNILDSTKIYKPDKIYKVAIAISFDSLPTFGYKSFYLDLGGNSHDKLEENLASRIENEFYSITVNANNTLDILDKKAVSFIKPRNNSRKW